jgi:hypothetical protein
MQMHNQLQTLQNDFIIFKKKWFIQQSIDKAHWKRRQYRKAQTEYEECLHP